MKRLRVLTGRHAGTDLLLPAGRHALSADAEADIRLLDWTGDALVLEIEEGTEDVSSATLRFASAEAGEAIADLVPRKFGETVLCVGPADASGWPADLELLGRLLRPAPAEAPASRASRKPARRWLMLGAVAGVVLLGGFIAVVTGAARNAEARLPPPSPVALAQKALEASRVRGVVVRPSPGGAIVEGLLPTPLEAAQLSAALEALPRGTVLRRYAAATDIAQSIGEALDEPKVTVKYLGDGEFIVEGAAVRAERLRMAAARIAADLAPLVRAIRLNVVDLPPPPKTPVGAMLETDGMAYVQTRDGTKHLSLPTLPVVELKDSELGNNPPVR